MADFGDASALVIRELTGGKRTLRFTERALPYRGSFELETEQRLNVTRNPGNSVGTATILGPVDGPSQISGMWKEKYVLFSSAGRGVAPPITLNNQAFISMKDIERTVDDFCRVGQLCEVTWDYIVRHGFLRRFKRAYQTVHDLSYTIEFEWISQGETVDPAVFVTLAGFDDVAAGIKKQLDALDQLEFPQGFGLNFGFIDTIQAFRNAIDDALNTVLDAVSQFTNKVATFVRTIRGISATFAGIEELCQDMLANLEATFLSEAGLDSGPSSVGGGGIYADQPYETQTEAQKVNAEVFKLDLKEIINALRYSTVDTKDKMVASLDGDVLAVVTPKAGQTLYDISAEQYGSPFEWRRIAAFNELTSPEVQPFDVLFIPRMNPQEAGTSCPGT